MKNDFDFFEKPKDPIAFNAIRIQLSSISKIREWSYGEIKKSETINYRTFKPERDGLFCAKIFGPVKDFECVCGKYKRMKHRGVVCEKCGVEVIRARVRRERLGHIMLATPVAHIWFLKSLPSRIGALLDLSQKSLERVLYCEAYAVIDVGVSDLPLGTILSEEEYQSAIQKYGEDSFLVSMGADAIRELLRRVEEKGGGRGIEIIVNNIQSELKRPLLKDAKRKKLLKRLKILDDFVNSSNKAEWMLMEAIPVLPPDLRPLVALDAGRFATSDLNDLYRRIINRNNRLRRLLELNSPEIIVRNEKRMLQEAVDALFDNGRRGRLITNSNKRPLKSLSETLKGKHGRFRQNLLGKRVDYSARSVIVVGPELQLHQCGIPKTMAIELFKPFLYHKLQETGCAGSIKSARVLVDIRTPDVWDALEEIIREYPVILNRAPTLHRLGMQAFEPILVEGNAIQLHPLVCTAFNADFDGDQMAVHIPLSIEAQIEARVLMMSTNNILSPASGLPSITPTQDIVLGCYYISNEIPFLIGHGMIFTDIKEVAAALEAGEVAIHTIIHPRIDNILQNTCVGRVLLYEILPCGIPFHHVNRLMDKKALGELINWCFRTVGQRETVLFVDRLKSLGLEYSTRSGISISINDMAVPASKPLLLKSARAQIVENIRLWNSGEMDTEELGIKNINTWLKVTDDIGFAMMESLSTDRISSQVNWERSFLLSLNPLFIMANSGARGSIQQIKQIGGMRGLMAKASGEIISIPIVRNFREGLTMLQYFISTHGARKGLADTALKTANSGYLTRRLVDVAQDSIVNAYDCGTKKYMHVYTLNPNSDRMTTTTDIILGRVAAGDIIDPVTLDAIVKIGCEIDERAVRRICLAAINMIKIRSVLHCELDRGVCILCYGRDLARGRLVNIGEAVGVVAAQSIGEPGTQLTMRTFHLTGVTITEKIDSFRLNAVAGFIKFVNFETTTWDYRRYVISKNSAIRIVNYAGRTLQYLPVRYSSILRIRSGQFIKPGRILFHWDPKLLPIFSKFTGMAIRKMFKLRETYEYAEKNRKKRVLIDPRYRKLLMSNKCDTRFYSKPTVLLETMDGRVITQIPLFAGLTYQGSDLEPWTFGQLIATIPRKKNVNQDITGGLPRVVEIFEARRPKDYTMASEGKAVVYGEISYPETRNRVFKMCMTPKNRPSSVTSGVLLPKHFGLRNFSVLAPIQPILTGVVCPHDVLRIGGSFAVVSHMIKEIQDVYTLQGVKINNKHIELILKQMLRRVKIISSGDSKFLVGEEVEKRDFKLENTRIKSLEGIEAVAAPTLFGITKAALTTESFISSASFQETTKILTEAAIAGKTDNLYGLKENVILGRLIPAGTGFIDYQQFPMKTIDGNLLNNKIARVEEVEIDQDKQQSLVMEERNKQRLFLIEHYRNKNNLSSIKSPRGKKQLSAKTFRPKNQPFMKNLRDKKQFTADDDNE